MRKSGLVEKIHGKYGLTSFGEVINDARQLIESGIRDYWQLEKNEFHGYKDSLGHRPSRRMSVHFPSKRHDSEDR
ncbi:MAG: hypothetical protein WAZ77_17435 [Candidatus Nitrosopolaris sp.]